MTDPDEARRFIAETGASCLAVSIGNIHGRYRTAPQLDWDRLERLHEDVPVPLTLHGASGLAPGDIARAICLGIRKLNVNTELRMAYLAATGECLPAAVASVDVLGLHDSQRQAVERAVFTRLAILPHADVAASA